MFQLQTQTAAYWTTKFRVNRADIEYLFSQLLENETPLSTRDLALSLVRFRIKQEEERLRKQIARADVFQPKHHYEVGQELVFPALGFLVGKVTGQRVGQNRELGDFSVIEVEFEGQPAHREFASALKTPHVLNIDESAGGQRAIKLPAVDPEAILDEYGDAITEELEARLVDEPDTVSVGDTWFLKSLLAPVNVGHLHLAEAVLDLAEGGPLTTAEILKDLDLAPELSPQVRELSLEVALAQDERFDNVGTNSRVQWFLRRLEPAEVTDIPQRLQCQMDAVDTTLLNDELRGIELELGDEFSALPAVSSPQKEAHITLIYPHRRVGTFPINTTVEAMLPPPEEAGRLRVTLIDGQTHESFAGWVMRDGRYIWGFSEFYRRHRLPIGASLVLRTTEDPLKFVIDFNAHRPRTEYIRLAVPNQGRLRFDNFKRSIGAVYDELMILGAEDLDGVDEVWTQTRNRRRSLVDIMIDLIPELARLNPQNAVHVKTLYSAVNILRRCPPGPIFAALGSRSAFQHVGGPYWRLSESR